MRTALDFPPDTLNEADQSFLANVREHGWFRTSVFGDDEGPGFSYTTGFWLSARHPELIIFSINHDTAHDMFWNLFRCATSGEPLPIGKRTNAIFTNLAAYAFPVAQQHYADFLCQSRWFYRGDNFPCLQIVWPDRAGLFPWEQGFNVEFQADQLDLTEKGWVNEITE